MGKKALHIPSLSVQAKGKSMQNHPEEQVFVQEDCFIRESVKWGGIDPEYQGSVAGSQEPAHRFLISRKLCERGNSPLYLPRDKSKVGVIALATTPTHQTGGYLLSHFYAVPSAQLGLTSLFGMGRGGTPTL